MAADFKILAYEDTDLGPLCLRRRMTLSEPRQWVTEITLNHEFLMSSLHTDSEQALATIPLKELEGNALRVLIGGLGLGYTAHASLACERVAQVDVVEYLPQVIQWMHDGLTPLGAELTAAPRLDVSKGDIYNRLLSEPTTEPYDAILIDVDHSPDDQLSDDNDAFYQADGLRSAARHLKAKGTLALWSYDQNTPLLAAMQQVFSETEVHPVSYYNQHVHEEFTDSLYVGRT